MPLNLELENKMLIAIICVGEAIYCNLCTCSVIHIKCIWALLGGRWATFLPFKNSLAVITLENGNFNCNDLSFHISLLGKCLSCAQHCLCAFSSELYQDCPQSLVSRLKKPVRWFIALLPWGACTCISTCKLWLPEEYVNIL